MKEYPFFPHTEENINDMLDKIGVKSLEELYSDVPKVLDRELNIPESLSEIEIKEHINFLSERNLNLRQIGSFRGAGIYNHYIPSVVYNIASKRGFLTAYTPYQAEVSQGTLQMIFEYQTMMCELTGMEVSNASMYDGATSVAEAALMAARVTKKSKTLIAKSINPEYIEVTKTYLEPQNFEIEYIDFDKKTGQIDIENLKNNIDENTNSVIVGYPNFFGIIEDIELIRKNVPEKVMLIVVVGTPIALGLLESPGKLGADIVVGDGQPLGNFPALGGPTFGYFASKMKYIRSMPGRIIGETVDSENNRAFTMVLQTREQHIRRDKATSNICSNHAHNTLLASIYLSLIGRKGLKKLADLNYQKAHYLAKRLIESEKFEPLFEGPFFNEFLVKSSFDIDFMNEKLLEENYMGPLNMNKFYSDMEDICMFCSTELNKKEDIDYVVSYLEGLI